MANFIEELNQLNGVESVIEVFNKEIFTVVSSVYPSLEILCQKVGAELIETLINQGKSCVYILETLMSLKNEKQIEKFITSNKIKLPPSKIMKISLITIFQQKLENAKKKLVA